MDASNHIIMDYSIHDAIEAGFNHVVFIIRKDIDYSGALCVKLSGVRPHEEEMIFF